MIGDTNFEIFTTLYDIGLMFAEFIEELWTWFVNPIVIGDWSFRPIDSLPIVGITLLVAWLIKTFVPLS